MRWTRRANVATDGPADRPIFDVIDCPVPLTEEARAEATRRVCGLLTIKSKRPHIWFLSRSDYLAWVQGVLDGAFGILVPGYDIGGPFLKDLEDPIDAKWVKRVNDHIFYQLSPETKK
jgi:hypothetical protein